MSNEKTPLIDEKQNRLAELKKKYFKLDENAMRRGPGGPGGPGNRAMQAKGESPALRWLRSRGF